MTAETVGFVGLGNMGGVLAANLVEQRFTVLGHDARGPDIAPTGVEPGADVAAVARRAEVVVLSLPDGAASEAVARELAAVVDRTTTHVVDTSTIGTTAAETIAALLAEHDVAYVDAPVSGGPAGARARTLAVMYAGSDAACTRVEPVLAGLSDRRFRVGDRAGLGQAMKLLNNFLSATTMAATSEAVAFGRSVGLDLATMLEVLNASSGRSGATGNHFPAHVLTGTYAAGFTNTLMAKDLALYHAAVERQGSPRALGELTAALWRRFAELDPGADFTRVFPFVAGS